MYIENLPHGGLLEKDNKTVSIYISMNRIKIFSCWSVDLLHISAPNGNNNVIIFLRLLLNNRIVSKSPVLYLPLRADRDCFDYCENCNTLYGLWKLRSSIFAHLPGPFVTLYVCVLLKITQLIVRNLSNC